MLQKTLSLGSVAGVLAVVVGVGIGMLILTQFEFGRKLTGASGKGSLSLS